ncbi:phosphopantetheine-binding protein [Teredinibacter waterburyi]|uniref:phosphopantetheine-binding protein n=1 Tax=Teredinibacter waterburyi TaxID=1500538 RepID=UPI00165F9854|nr:phosphopantetheine-binding protein [Teredinibacter waterburyi]
MTDKSVEERIKALLLTILEGSVAEADLGFDTQLINGGLSLDSMVQLRTLNALEAEFDIEVDDDDIEESIFQNIQTLSAYVRTK